MNTNQKTCFKCGETKPRSEYYEHPQMGDGLLGKCKECTKLDVRRSRSDATRAYDRRRYAERKHEHVARIALQVAVSKGEVERPDACWHCGSTDRIEGHHADYGNPLGVMFLCKSCHADCHKLTTALRGGSEYSRKLADRLGIRRAT